MADFDKDGRYLAFKHKNPVKAIREFCVECMGGNRLSVNDCTTTVCALHDFRTGKNPFRKPQSDEQREASRLRLAKATVKATANARNKDE